VVSREQLLAAGIGASAIATRLDRRSLLPIHRGVYAVGHTALAPLAEEMAAVLACGRGAAISHRAAAVLQRILERREAIIDVTVGRSNRRRPGLRVHRSRTLTSEDVLIHQGIPVTTMPLFSAPAVDVEPPSCAHWSPGSRSPPSRGRRPRSTASL
jgi:hypothetical protein